MISESNFCNIVLTFILSFISYMVGAHYGDVRRFLNTPAPNSGCGNSICGRTAHVESVSAKIASIGDTSSGPQPIQAETTTHMSRDTRTKGIAASQKSSAPTTAAMNTQMESRGGRVGTNTSIHMAMQPRPTLAAGTGRPLHQLSGPPGTRPDL